MPSPNLLLDPLLVKGYKLLDLVTKELSFPKMSFFMKPHFLSSHPIILILIPPLLFLIFSFLLLLTLIHLIPFFLPHLLIFSYLLLILNPQLNLPFLQIHPLHQFLQQILQTLMLFMVFLLNLNLKLLLGGLREFPNLLLTYNLTSAALFCAKSTHSNSSIKSGIPYPLSLFLDSSKISPSYNHLCSLITNDIEPNSYHEVVLDPKWQEAIAVEIAAFDTNNTWTNTKLVSLSQFYFLLIRFFLSISSSFLFLS